MSVNLSCLRICCLNRMLDICNKFAAEHYLIFNSKKLPALMYGKEVNDTEYVLLGQNAINRVDGVKHLGNSYDRIDCMMKRSTFIGSANKLMTEFCHLQAYVNRLCNIFYDILLQFGTSSLLV